MGAGAGLCGDRRGDPSDVDNGSGKVREMSTIIRRKRYPLSRSRIDMLDWGIAICRGVAIGLFFLLLVMAVLKGVEGG